MNLEELKKLREKNFSKHKEKKRAYYLKSKIKKEIDYEDELKDDGFLKKMQEIVKSQRLYMDSRQETIKKKIEEYQILKRDYYEQNKEKKNTRKRKLFTGVRYVQKKKKKLDKTC